jgi:antibiotic biosynthesis monooxygenase (ABM) superfamily enzyme
MRWISSAGSPHADAVDPTDTASPVTVVVARAVAGGHEEEFHHWAQRLTNAAERFPASSARGCSSPPRHPGRARRRGGRRFS